jgi:hypothetical protein
MAHWCRLQRRYLMTAPGIVGMVVGFLLLDERDARTLAALRVTPLSPNEYMVYRAALPLVGGTAATLIGYPLVGISPLPVLTLMAIACVASFSSPVVALVLGAAAPNKVGRTGGRQGVERHQPCAYRSLLRATAFAVICRRSAYVLADADAVVGGRGGPLCGVPRLRRCRERLRGNRRSMVLRSEVASSRVSATALRSACPQSNAEAPWCHMITSWLDGPKPRRRSTLRLIPVSHAPTSAPGQPSTDGPLRRSN